MKAVFVTHRWARIILVLSKTATESNSVRLPAWDEVLISEIFRLECGEQREKPCRDNGLHALRGEEKHFKCNHFTCWYSILNTATADRARHSVTPLRSREKQSYVEDIPSVTFLDLINYKLPEDATNVRETQLQEVPEQVSRNIFSREKTLTFDSMLRCVRKENRKL